MNTRPDFDSIKNFEEFSRYYWYREELIKICKKLGLKDEIMAGEVATLCKGILDGKCSKFQCFIS